jgi:hypothetical protein
MEFLMPLFMLFNSNKICKRNKNKKARKLLILNQSRKRLTLCVSSLK